MEERQFGLSGANLLSDEQRLKTAGEVYGGGSAAAGVGRMISKQEADPWKHRSEGMRCKTCMWFAHKQPEPVAAASQYTRRGDVGRCRRHAPTVGGYPVVFVNDWCGDHRLNENSL